MPRGGNPSPVPPGVVYGAQPGPPGGFAETRGGRVVSVERRGPGTLRFLQRVCFTFGFPRGAGRALRLPALARALVLVGASRFAESPRLPQPPVPRGDGPGGPRACRCDVPPAACPRPRTSPDVTQAPALLRLGGWGGATPPAAPASRERSRIGRDLRLRLRAVGSFSAREETMMETRALCMRGAPHSSGAPRGVARCRPHVRVCRAGGRAWGAQRAPRWPVA